MQAMVIKVNDRRAVQASKSAMADKDQQISTLEQELKVSREAIDKLKQQLIESEQSAAKQANTLVSFVYVHFNVLLGWL